MPKKKYKPSAASRDHSRQERGAAGHGYKRGSKAAKRYIFGHNTNVHKGKFNKGKRTHA